MVPTNSSSLSIGTTRIVRAPARSTRCRRRRVALGVKRRGTEIGRMRELPGPDDLREDAVGPRTETILPRRQKVRRDIVEADGANAVSLQQIHQSKLCAANTCRILQHTLEHRLEIAGGPTDHAKYFGRCRLLLQRFRKVHGSAPALRRTAEHSRSRSLPGRRRSRPARSAALYGRTSLLRNEMTPTTFPRATVGRPSGAIPPIFCAALWYVPVGQYIRDVEIAAFAALRRRLRDRYAHRALEAIHRCVHVGRCRDRA